MKKKVSFELCRWIDETVEEFHVDVGIFSDGDRRPGKSDSDEKVAGYLLGPGDRVVEYIAAEKLGEDNHRQSPEKPKNLPRPLRASRHPAASAALPLLWVPWSLSSPPRLFSFSLS